MAAQQDDGNVTPELLGQLEGLAKVLEVFDEGREVALRLHSRPFDPHTRDECLAYFDSPRYRDALSAINQTSRDNP